MAVQRQLFQDQQEVDNKRKLIGNGYALEWVTDRIVIIYRYGVIAKKVEIKSGIDKRRLVVELVLEAGVTKSKLAEALNVSRQSVDNWIDTFKKSGFEGLVNSYKGSRQEGRAENGDKLPKGNKARQLEEERRHKREALHERQLTIYCDEEESGSCEDEADIFNDSYGFQENRYAGGFIYWALFQHLFNFMQLCESYLGSYGTVIYLFALMLVHGIGSVEQLKTVYKREFGKVIGIKQLFSIPTLWQRIHAACSLRASKALIEGFFRRQAINGLVSLYWLYIDGHFIPYYGNEPVHKGYYTQRDLMMPGQTEMFVHDCHGQIVYFEIQEGKGDLKEMMIRMSQKWSAYIGDTPPLIIADRESWGVEHFLSMEGYRFVTWEKFSKPEELASIADGDFGEVFTINEKEYQVYEDKKLYCDDQGNSIELRRVVIWNKRTGRRVACVAQDALEDTITIACAMLGRWGCSENSFKHMGERCNMHYNPLVDTSEESEAQEIINPDIKNLKKQISQLKKKLAKCERELGRLPITTKKDGSVRKSKKRERLEQKRAQLKEELAVAEQKVKSCPERIKLDEVKPGEKFKELDTEGKNLWDLAETLVWNSRKKIIEIFAEFLPNPRDLIPVLEAITNSRGWVKSTREAVEVRLEPLDIPRFKVAQIQLCRALNEKNI
ncbi:MAG: helix-turn-helix domain-containing protein, partial [Dehalococcoidia bacterium]